MTNICPKCKSTNTQEIGGTDHMNVACNNCGTLYIITWQNYKARAEKLTEERANSLGTLRRIAAILNAEDPESYRRDDPHGAMDTAFALAQEAITKATGA